MAELNQLINERMQLQLELAVIEQQLEAIDAKITRLCPHTQVREETCCDFDRTRQYYICVLCNKQVSYRSTMEIVKKTTYH